MNLTSDEPNPGPDVRSRLAERYGSLADLAICHELLIDTGLGHVLTADLDTLRLTDLARAVWLLEFSTEVADESLVVLPFMTRDDTRRNRGFEGVESEMMNEDAWLLDKISQVQP